MEIKKITDDLNSTFGMLIILFFASILDVLIHSEFRLYLFILLVVVFCIKLINRVIKSLMLNFDD